MSNRIIIEAGLTGNPYNGHFSYCKNLGLSMRKLFGKKYAIYFLLMNDNRIFKLEKPIKMISYRLYKYFLRYIKKFKVWHVTYQLTDLLPLNKETKIILTIHDLNFLKEKDPSEIKKDLAILQQNINISEKIVAISNYVKKDIEMHCDLKGKEVTVIYNGCSIDENIIQKLDSRKAFDKGNFIFSIGVIAKKKNFHILPYLLLGNDLNLVISGFIQDQGYYNHILEIAKNLGVSDRVHLTGPIDETKKYQLYRDCTLFAFPSYAEGFGLPVVEAMRFGKKTLLSKHCSLPEIGGNLSYYLESEEEEYLRNFAQNELPTLLAKPENQQEIIARSKQFNWDFAAAQYEVLYSEILTNK